MVEDKIVFGESILGSVSGVDGLSITTVSECDIIKFEKVKRFADVEFDLPKRLSVGSAGYDFFLPCDVTLTPYSKMVSEWEFDEFSTLTKPRANMIPLGVKAKFPGDVALMIYLRSSFGIKEPVHLAQGVGIIDCDYYNNPDNEGEIFVPVVVYGNEYIHLKKGQRVAQGIFQSIRYVTAEEVPEGQRVGGMGSSGR